MVTEDFQYMLRVKQVHNKFVKLYEESEKAVF